MADLWTLMPWPLRIVVVGMLAGTAWAVVVVLFDLWHLLFTEGEPTDVETLAVSLRPSCVDPAGRAAAALPALSPVPESEPWLGIRATGAGARARRDAVIGRDQASRERRLRLIALQGGRR